MSMKARLAAALYPRHIDAVDTLNRTPLVRQWIAEQRERIPQFATVREFYRFVNNEVCGGGAIDFLEFGVFQGNSIRFWSEMNTAPDSRFIGFDSFEGLPEAWLKMSSGTFDAGGATPSVDDARVRFVKGWFQETLPGFLDGFAPRSRLVVHNDSDLYSSTLFTLARLDPLLIPGTVLIFDEFSVAMHEFRAFEDYRSAFLRTARPVAMTSRRADQVAFVFD